MKKIALTYCLLALCSLRLLADGLTVTTQTLTAENPVACSINLELSASGITAYEFLLTLPEGVEWVKDIDGNYIYKLSDRHGADHSLTVTIASGGRYACVCHSPLNAVLTGTEGLLFTLWLKADGSIEGQQHLAAQLTNARISSTDGHETLLDDVAFEFAVSFPVITIENATREYGEANPAFTYSVAGATLQGEPTLSTEATVTSPVGEYPITASKGTIGNSYYEVTNGTLTIIPAPLTVSIAGEYSRYEGEDNPDFQLNYRGWKMEDDERVLTSKPVVVCEADALSPAGEYPIMVMGGEAQNYTLSYIEGVLTVLARESTDSVSVIIETEGAGRIRVGETEVEEETRTVFVPKGRHAVLEILPDEGYCLAKLTVGDVDVTDELTGNRFVIPSVENDTTVYVVFMEDIETFMVDGIRYGVTNLTAGEVKVIAGDYTGSLSIPSQVSHGGREWTVTGLDRTALRGCPWLVTVSVPQTVTSVGQDLFKKDRRLAAIRWESPVKMDRPVMGDFTNPNMLLYMKDASCAPEGAQNIIVDGVAERIVLTDVAGDDNCDFFCPEAFTARHISYEHAYTQSTLLGRSQGWETLALPFDVQEVHHRSQGIVQPFAALTEEAIEAGSKPFWLYSYPESDTYERAASIKANTPYIISMPNDPAYEAEYILGGLITFSADNVEVRPTADAVDLAIGAERLFTPCFSRQPNGQNLFCINSYQSYAAKPEGSIFVRNLRAARPFEAYFRYSAGAEVKEWFDVFEKTTDIDDIVNRKSSNGKMYDLSGRQIVNGKWSNRLIPRGVYIVNGRKLIR